MKILFYMEPWIERRNPMFRFASLKNDFPYSLISEKDDIKLISGEWAEIYLTEKNENIDYIFISEKELRAISNNYLEAQITLYKYRETTKNLNKYKKLFKNKLGTWEPDLIITYEGVTQHLEYTYKKARVLNQEWEMLLRILGIEGFVFKTKNKTLNAPNWNEVYFLSLIRKKFIKKINSYENTSLNHIRKNYKKIILLPLQGDHFNFQGNTKYLNQFDMIIDVLNTVPDEVGVIVVEHPMLQEKDLILKGNIDFLRKKYDNFIFLEELRKLTSASTYVIKYVDAVASVSSSLISQAMLYKKPVIQIGENNSKIPLPKLLESIENGFKLLDDSIIDEYLIDKIFYSMHIRNKISNEHILNDCNNIVYEYSEWRKILK